MNTEENVMPKMLTKKGFDLESKNDELELPRPNELTNNKEKDTNSIPMVRGNSSPEGTNESPIDSFVPLQSFLHQELLQANSLINESTTLLHGQTKRLLEQESDVRSPSEWAISLARQNMETMAKMIQTKVNFIKAVRR